MSSKWSLKAHVSKVHEKDKVDKPSESDDKREKEPKCNLSTKVLGQNAALKNDKNVQCSDNKGKNFQCDVCKASYTSKSGLIYHIDSVHIGRRKYQCNDCSAAFLTKGVLKSHIRSVHEIIKEYPCPICHKAFAFRAVLKQHVMGVHQTL